MPLNIGLVLIRIGKYFVGDFILNPIADIHFSFAFHVTVLLPISCPCDVYPGSKFVIGPRNVPTNDNWTPKLSKAPRESVFGREISTYTPMRNRELGKEDWFGIEGSLNY